MVADSRPAAAFSVSRHLHTFTACLRSDINVKVSSGRPALGLLRLPALPKAGCIGWCMFWQAGCHLTRGLVNLQPACGPYSELAPGTFRQLRCMFHAWPWSPSWLTGDSCSILLHLGRCPLHEELDVRGAGASLSTLPDRPTETSNYDINLGLLVGKIIPNCLRKNACFNHKNPPKKWAVYMRTGIVGKSASCVAQNLQSLTIRCERKSSPPQQDGEVPQRPGGCARRRYWYYISGCKKKLEMAFQIWFRITRHIQIRKRDWYTSPVKSNSDSSGILDWSDHWALSPFPKTFWSW